MPQFSKKPFKVLMGTLLVYAVLVSTHKGEFWPFSIYPMFSKAGQPWTRAIVRDVSNTPDDLRWQTTQFDSIRGDAIALRTTGVDQIDFSNFISKTQNWTEKRKQALITMFGPSNLGDESWMIHKVNGRLIGKDSVTVEAVPFLMVTRDSVTTNPTLPPKAYSQ